MAANGQISHTCSPKPDTVTLYIRNSKEGALSIGDIICVPDAAPSPRSYLEIVLKPQRRLVPCEVGQVERSGIAGRVPRDLHTPSA